MLHFAGLVVVSGCLEVRGELYHLGLHEGVPPGAVQPGCLEFVWKMAEREKGEKGRVILGGIKECEGGRVEG